MRESIARDATFVFWRTDQQSFKLRNSRVEPPDSSLGSIHTRNSKEGIIKALVMIIGFASSCFAASYLAQELPVAAVLFSLLIGFAPLIGLGVLLVIVALLISFLIIKVEQTLTDEDDCIVPEPHCKSKWRRVALCLSDLLARCLSLKEHSPPALLFS